MTLPAAVDVLIAVLAAAVLALGAFALRRRVLTRGGGTFECSLRVEPGAHGKGWTLGVGRYAGETLHWYRVFSFSMRPGRSLSRSSLQVLDRRRPTGVETFALLSGAVVLACRDADGPVELAVSADALTGFLAWVESSPPGVQRG